VAAGVVDPLAGAAGLRREVVHALASWIGDRAGGDDDSLGGSTRRNGGVTESASEQGTQPEVGRREVAGGSRRVQKSLGTDFGAEALLLVTPSGLEPEFST
jgi:hypothetical protein